MPRSSSHFLKLNLTHHFFHHLTRKISPVTELTVIIITTSAHLDFIGCFISREYVSGSSAQATIDYFVLTREVVDLSEFGEERNHWAEFITYRELTVVVGAVEQ